MKYIYPPRTKESVPRAETHIFKKMQWIAQLKYNDSHAIIKYSPDGIELWNRHAERFRTYHAPLWLLDELHTLADKLGHDKSKTTILDGGLLDQKHHHIKNTIVVWDILAHNDKQLIGTTYNERYQSLLERTTDGHHWYCTINKAQYNFGLMISDNIFIPKNIDPDDWDTTWQMITEINATWPGKDPLLEGLVFKDPQGILEFGFSQNNNSSWMIKSRVRTGRHAF